MAINRMYGTGVYNARLPGGAIRVPSLSGSKNLASPLSFFPSTQHGTIDAALEDSVLSLISSQASDSGLGSSAPSSASSSSSLGSALGLSGSQTSALGKGIGFALSAITQAPALATNSIGALAATSAPQAAVDAFADTALSAVLSAVNPALAFANAVFGVKGSNLLASMFPAPVVTAVPTVVTQAPEFDFNAEDSLGSLGSFGASTAASSALGAALGAAFGAFADATMSGAFGGALGAAFGDDAASSVALGAMGSFGGALGGAFGAALGASGFGLGGDGFGSGGDGFGSGGDSSSDGGSGLGSGGVGGNGCYITTAVCKLFHREDDCYELTTMRRFRDEFVQVHYPEAVEKYYATAPALVRKIEAREDSAVILAKLYRYYIVPAVEQFTAGRPELAYTIYTDMVNYVIDL